MDDPRTEFLQTQIGELARAINDADLLELVYAMLARNCTK